MSTEMADLVLEDADEKMHKAVVHARAEFASIRTGRAAPALVEKLPVEYYGTETPLQQLASFKVPEARQLLITPYDKSLDRAPSRRRMQQSDLGLNPSNDGHAIRLSFPPLTAERRKEFVKLVKNMAEEGKITLRNHRRAAPPRARGDEEGQRALRGRAQALRGRARQAASTSTKPTSTRAFGAKEKELLED